MRKSILSIAPAFVLALALTGCGDDTTGSSSSLTSQDRSTLSGLSAISALPMSLANSSSVIASSKAISSSDALKPSGARKFGTGCNTSMFDTVIALPDGSMGLHMTNGDGSNFASCEEAVAAYTSPGGIRIVVGMVMSRYQEGMSTGMHATFDMLYLPNLSTGGYTMNSSVLMDVTTTGQGQNLSLTIAPMNMVMTTASKDAEPTTSMDASMSMTANGLSLTNLKFNATGLVPMQTIDIFKNGTKVATMEVDANGQSLVKDLSGAVIKAES